MRGITALLLAAAPGSAGCGRPEPKVIPQGGKVTREEYNRISGEEKQNPGVLRQLERSTKKGSRR